MDQNQFNGSGYFAPTPPVKNAAYFRARARQALKNCYWWAVLAAFLATLLGGIAGGGIAFSSSTTTTGTTTNTTDINSLVNTYEKAGGLVGLLESHPELLLTLQIILIVTAIVTVFALAFTFLVSCPVRLGYLRYNLDVLDGNGKSIASVFSFFKKGYGKSMLAYLVYQLIFFVIELPFTLLMGFVLWSYRGPFLALLQGIDFLGNLALMINAFLICFAISIPLLVITVILQYRYAFAYMILAEYPEMRVGDAFRNSAALMKGKKWKLFCLQFSFIGWILLAFCTCGIGLYFLLPYTYAAEAAFYDDITNRSAANETEFPSLDPNDYQVES